MLRFVRRELRKRANKAIGWAMREYAKTNPAAVKRFLRSHGDRLSTLSFREAAKHLGLKR